MMVIICRGVPGSGKSTWVRNNITPNVICSADDWFIGRDGIYRWKSEQIRLAHEWCFDKFKLAVKRQEATIVLDNTNTRLSEYEHYISFAEAAKYEVTIIEFYCPDEKTAIAFAERNRHNVPIESVIRMWQRFAHDERATVIHPNMV